MPAMSCSACGHTITAADPRGLAAGVRRHVEGACAAAAPTTEVSPAFLEAVRRIRGEPIAVP